MTYTPSLFKTSSKAPLNFVSRSRTILQLPGQIPRLLHHPLAGGMGGHPGEVNAAAADLNEEEDVEQAQPDRVHGEEVAGQDLVGVLVDELAPGALATARRREHAVAAQHPLHGLVRATVAELEQLALDATKAPTRVLSGEANDELVQLAPWSWPTALGSPPIRGPFTPDQLSGSREARYVPTVGPARTSLAFPTQARIPRVHGDFARFLPAPPHRPWGFSPAGERWRPISAVFPCNGGQTARTPPMPASTPHGLPSPSSVALTEVLSPISRVPRCRGGCRAEPHPPPVSSKPWTAFTQRSFAPGACCCSPIIAPTTSAARLSATLRFPVSRL